MIRYKVHGALLILFAALAVATPAFPHHSEQAEFDPNKEFTATGVLSKIDWINPHIAVWVDAKDETTGKVESWGCEGNPPSTLSRVGVRKDMFKIGEEVAMTCSAPKDGTRLWGYIKMVKYLSDGHVIVLRMNGK